MAVYVYALAYFIKTLPEISWAGCNQTFLSLQSMLSQQQKAVECNYESPPNGSRNCVGFISTLGWGSKMILSTGVRSKHRQIAACRQSAADIIFCKGSIICLYCWWNCKDVRGHGLFRFLLIKKEMTMDRIIIGLITYLHPSFCRLYWIICVAYM